MSTSAAASSTDSAEAAARASSWQSQDHLQAVADMFEVPLEEYTDPKRRLSFIHKQPILHWRLERALKQVQTSLSFPDDPITVIIAPAGSGKTCIQEELIRRINHPYHFDRRYRRVVRLKAETYSGQTHWTSLNQKLERALVVPQPGKNNHECRENIKTWIRNRKTEVVLIDEAHDLLPTSKARSPLRDAKILKSLVENIPKTKLVLLGTHTLLPLSKASGEMARRNESVHLRRYHSEIPEDLETFKIILEYIDESCRPWLGDIRLSQDPVGTFQGCRGLIGQLRNWLSNALRYSEDNGIDHITPSSLRAARKTDDQLDIMVRDCDEAEKECAMIDRKAAEIYPYLGI